MTVLNYFWIACLGAKSVRKCVQLIYNTTYFTSSQNFYHKPALNNVEYIGFLHVRQSLAKWFALKMI